MSCANLAYVRIGLIVNVARLPALSVEGFGTLASVITKVRMPINFGRLRIPSVNVPVVKPQQIKTLAAIT